jgi:hypothetical protein
LIHLNAKAMTTLMLRGPIDNSGGWNVSARNFFPVARNGDQACSVLSRPEVARLADFIASELAQDEKHSQRFMVYAVDKHGSEVIKLMVAPKMRTKAS